MLKEMMASAWEERKVPKERVNADLISIPKKGNLTSCDNWRDVALLEVMGKVVARVIQGRLQRLAEKELPESKCDFRKGRGCTHMAFMLGNLWRKQLNIAQSNFWFS